MGNSVFDSFWLNLLWYAPCLAAVPAAKGLAHLFQLGSYQFEGYLAALRRQWKEFLPGLCLSAFSLLMLVLGDRLARSGGPLWLGLAAFLTLLFGGALGYFVHRKAESIRRLRFTPRLLRLFFALLIVMLALGALLKALLPHMGMSALLPLLLPLWLALAAFLIWPLEHLIKMAYQKDAQRILFSQPGLIRIGVTGSYGKTSVKFFLETMLKQRYSVLATRESFNTPMGITRVIREDMEPAHRVFIAEMGARHRRDIRDLCRFVQPTIGILTAVGPQHLETFGTLERVRDTKYDLILSLQRYGFAVFWNDGGIVRGLYDRTDRPKAIVGEPGDDLWAEDLELTYEGSRFTLCTRDGSRIKCETELCGEHNIDNILLAAAAARHLGLSDRQLRRAIQMLRPVKARFQPEKRPDGSIVINNGFNASPESSRASLALLSNFPGRKIVVTPGFVELGQMERDYHLELGRHMAKAADLVLLIGPRRTQPIRQGLLEEGFPEEKILTFKRLREAQQHIQGIVRPGDVILYENDLPDQYTES